jgi:hypothetical protein
MCAIVYEDWCEKIRQPTGERRRRRVRAVVSLTTPACLHRLALLRVRGHGHILYKITTTLINPSPQKYGSLVDPVQDDRSNKNISYHSACFARISSRYHGSSSDSNWCQLCRRWRVWSMMMMMMSESGRRQSNHQLTVSNWIRIEWDICFNMKYNIYHYHITYHSNDHDD